MSAPPQTSLLAVRLRERIEREGALSFREWMAAALYDEQGGYYCRADRVRWGRTGDYRTSPERSPLFASTFARYFATLYQELGSPRTWTLLEAGAGAGDFARGVLETLRDDHPRAFEATRYCLDEVSPDARAQARDNLSAFADRIQFCSLRERRAAFDYGIVFSNELFDAFPVHRVRRRGDKLYELCVGLNEAGGFVWVEREPATLLLAEHFARGGVALAEGHVAEVNADAAAWLEAAAAALTRGYVVTVDYGAEAADLYQSPARREGTLRGFQAHQLVTDILAQPGAHDLTSTVNWTQLRAAGEAAGLENVSLERQDEFLLRAGLLAQLEQLDARETDEAARLQLRLGAREMILPGGMSQNFQVLVQKKREGHSGGDRAPQSHATRNMTY